MINILNICMALILDVVITFFYSYLNSFMMDQLYVKINDHSQLFFPNHKEQNLIAALPWI